MGSSQLGEQAGPLQVQRETNRFGAAGLRTSGTRLPHKRSACQWMRAITPKVIRGWRKNALRWRAGVASPRVPLTQVNSTGPCLSWWSTWATKYSKARWACCWG